MCFRKITLFLCLLLAGYPLFSQKGTTTPIADSLFEAGNFTGAVTAYLNAGRNFLEQKDSANWLRSERKAIHADWKQGNRQRAIEDAEALLSRLQLRSRQDREFDIQLLKLWRLVVVGYFSLQEFEPMEAACRKGLRLARLRGLEDLRETAHFYGYLGQYYYTIGDYELALKNHTQDYHILLELEDPGQADRGICTYNIGNCYWGLTQLDSAIHYYQLAENHFQLAFGDKDQRYLQTLKNLGGVAWDQGNKDLALHYFSKVKAKELEEKGAIADEGEAFRRKGEAELGAARYEDAVNYFQAALAFREKTFGENHPLTVACKNYIASGLERRGLMDSALQVLQSAICGFLPEFNSLDWHDNPTDFTGVTNPVFLLETMISKSFIIGKMGFSQENSDLMILALETEWKTAELIQLLRRRRFTRDSEAFWTRKVFPFYEHAIGTAYALFQKTGDQRFTWDAFMFSESAKAFSLTMNLREIDAKSMAGIPEEVLIREKSLKNELGRYTSFLESEELKCGDADRKKMDLWREACLRIEGELLTFEGELEQKYPAYFEYKYDDPRIEPGQIADFLNRSHLDQARIIFWGDSLKLCFILDGEQTVIHEIDKCSGGDLEIQRFLEAIRSGRQVSGGISPGDYQKMAFELFSCLFPDNLQGDSIQRILLVPDGPLHELPFDVLTTREISQPDFQKLPYLIRSAEISYSPSMKLAMRRPANPRSGREYMGFAPDFPDSGKLIQGVRFYPLAGNAKEVEEGMKICGGKIFKGREANRARFRSQAEKAGILHLATHAWINPDHVESTGFLLAESDDSVGHGFNGFFRAGEIYGMEIQAGLVILSACNSGNGKWLKGEGIYSLGNAFQYAGVRNTVYNLWEVDDLSGQEIIPGMLAQVKNGHTPSAALRQAKLDFLEKSDKRFAHPFFWGGWAIRGIPERIPVGNTMPWGIFLIAGLLATGILLTILKIRSRDRKL